MGAEPRALPTGPSDDLAGPQALDAEQLAQLHARFATVIHDYVLQSLSISLVQVELSRRLCEAGRQNEAVAELDTAAQQLQAAADVLHQVMRDLSVSARALAIPT